MSTRLGLADLDALGRSLPSWPVFPEVPSGARGGRDAGWKLAILSNSDRDFIEASMASIGVEFELAIVASEIGSYKPALGHWRAFEQRIGRLPTSTSRPRISTTSSRRRSSESQRLDQPARGVVRAAADARAAGTSTVSPARSTSSRNATPRPDKGSKLGRLMSGHIDVSIEQKAARRRRRTASGTRTPVRVPVALPGRRARARRSSSARSATTTSRCRRASGSRSSRTPDSFVEEAAELHSEDPLGSSTCAPTPSGWRRPSSRRGSATRW